MSSQPGITLGSYRGERTATVSVHVARAILFGASLYGVDPNELRKAFQLSDEEINDVEGRIPAKMAVRLWDAASKLANEPDFGLLLGEKIASTTHITWKRVLHSAPTLGEGVDYLFQFHRLFNDVHPPERIETSEGIILRYTSKGSELEIPRHGIEFGFGFLIELLRGAVDEPVRFQSVYFEHEQPAQVQQHQRIFQCPILFAQPYSQVLISKGVYSLPTKNPDPDLLAMFVRFAETSMQKLPVEDDWSAIVQQCLSGNIEKGKISAEEIAKILHVSLRSLHRKLADENTTFQQVLDDTRYKLAKHYLTNKTLSMDEIARKIGFSSQSAFHKAFVRWSGSTPGQFRKDTIG